MAVDIEHEDVDLDRMEGLEVAAGCRGGQHGPASRLTDLNIQTVRGAGWR